MELNDAEVAALQAVVAAKLRMWDAASAAEKLIGCEIDTNSDEFECLCAGLDRPEDAEIVTADELAEVFNLHVCDDDCRSNGCPR